MKRIFPVSPTLSPSRIRQRSAQFHLAEWVRGIGTADKLDLLVQQSIGRLFVESFTATDESLAAARIVL
jgi:hypothetical protein